MRSLTPLNKILLDLPTRLKFSIDCKPVLASLENPEYVSLMAVNVPQVSGPSLVVDFVDWVGSF